MRPALQHLLTSLVAAALLTSCTQAPPRPAQPPTAPTPEPEPPPPVPEPPRPRVSDSERLLYYYQYLLGLAPEQVAREAERTQRFFGQSRSDFALLQLVLLRILPGSTPRDRTQATDVLGQYLKETRDQAAELRPFALMLNNLLQEQHRLDVDLQAQTQKLKDEGRRYDELKQKLDALIETERKMLERSNPTRTKK